MVKLNTTFFRPGFRHRPIEWLLPILMLFICCSLQQQLQAQCTYANGTFFVSASGNNATGTVNDPSMPYATLSGAISAAEAAGGDAIVSLQDATYTDNSIGVSIAPASVSGNCIDINGNGAVIDATAASVGFIAMSGTNNTLQNLTLTGFNWPVGAVNVSGTNFLVDGLTANANESANFMEVTGVGTISNSTFAQNEQSAIEVTGGATVVDFNGVDLVCNSNDFSGGSMFVGGGATVNFNGGSYSGNYSSTQGGALYITGDASVNIDGTVFTDNISKERGGAIYVDEGANFNITNAVFTGNSATGSYPGGAIWLQGPSASSIVNGTITSTLFYQNGSNAANPLPCVGPPNAQGSCGNSGTPGGHMQGGGGDGGAIYFGNNSDLTIDNSLFVGNIADDGGAIVTKGLSASTLVINNSTFTDNNSRTSSNGAVHTSSSHTITINNSILFGNGPGTDFNGSSNVTINNSTVGTGSGYTDGGGNTATDPSFDNTAGCNFNTANTAGSELPNTFADIPATDCTSPVSLAPLGSCVVACLAMADTPAGTNMTLCAAGGALTGTDAATDAGQADYTVLYLLVNAANVIVDNQSTPAALTAPAHTDAAATACAGLAAAEVYTIYTLEYETTQGINITNNTSTILPGDANVFTDNSAPADAYVDPATVEACMDLSPAGLTVTVLPPVIIEYGTPTCDAGNETYTQAFTVCGGSGTYTAALTAGAGGISAIVGGAGTITSITQNTTVTLQVNDDTTPTACTTSLANTAQPCGGGPALSITKANNPATTVQVGDVITYTLVVTNTGTVTTNNVLITDAVPTNTTLVNGSTMHTAGIAPIVSNPATPNWTVSALAAGESTTVSFQVMVNTGTAAATVIPNTATTESDEVTIPVPSNEVNNTVVAPILAITKANNPTGDVQVGNVITYTLVVSNTATGAGAGDATNVLIADVAPVNTTLVAGSMTHTAGVAPIMPNPATPNWTIATLQPSESTTVTFQVTVDASTPANTVITNTATTESDEIITPVPSNPVNNTVVISCGCTTCPPAPAMTAVMVSGCPVEEGTYPNQAAQDAAADGTAANPFATWRGAIEFAIANNINHVQFVPGNYETDNSVFNAFSLANGGHPITLAGMYVDGAGATITNTSTGAAGFANIGADNVTITSINLVDFGQALTVEDDQGFTMCSSIIDGSDNNGVNGAYINSDTRNTTATFINVQFNNHDTPNFTSAMDIVASSTTAAINTTVNFCETTWSCNDRDGFGGALFIGHAGSRASAAAGPVVCMNGGGFYGNEGLGASSDGGALNVQDNASLTIDGTAFVCNINNSTTGTSGGGAIRIQGGAAVTIENANFTGNTSTQYGGAILFNVNTGDPGLTINNTVFYNNTADRGGAVYLSDETQTTITSSYFEGNTGSATGFGGNGGGGIFIDGGGNTIVNIDGTTITNNNSNDSGAGGINFENASASDALNLTNSVVCGNAVADITSSATVTTDAGTVIGTGTSAQGNCAAIPAASGFQGTPAVALTCPATCPATPSTASSCATCLAMADTPAGTNMTLCAAGGALTGTDAATDAGQADYTVLYLLVNAANVIVDNQSTPAALTAPAHTDAAATACAGLAAAEVYTIYTLEYETTQGINITNNTSTILPGDANVFTDNSAPADAYVDPATVEACMDLSPAGLTVTVLPPVIIEYGTPTCDAGNTTYTQAFTVCGGSGTYTGALTAGIGGVSAIVGGAGTITNITQNTAVTLQVNDDTTPTACTTSLANTAQSCGAPELEIVKSNSPNGTVEVGDVITYTLVVTNTASGAGAGDATNVLITDAAPANTTLVAGSTMHLAGIAPTTASPATPDWTVATLTPGQSTTVSFQVTVDAATAAGTVIPNVATTTSDELPVIPSNEVDNTVVAPILEITKSNNPMGDVEVGDVITYTLVVTNTATGAGAGSATNVLINDLAPANTTLVGGSMAYVSGITPVVASPATPDWTVLTLAPGESTEVSFQVTVDAGTPAGTVIPNTATTTSDELPVIPSNEVDNTVVAPILEITKSNSPMGDVEVGDVITYTLVVTNTATGAGAGSATNVLINDLAPTNTTLVGGSMAYVSGVTPVVASPATPDWTVLTLAPGESTEVSFQVTVDAGTPAGTVIPNTATTTSDELPVIPSNEVDNTVVAPILEITKSNSPMGDVEVGDVITYTLVVTNTASGAGAGDATNVLITDAAPANTTFVAGSTMHLAGIAPTTASPATPDWTVLTLAPGESTEVSFQVTVDAGTPAGTVIPNTATTTSDELPVIPSNEVDNTVVAPILEITKSNNPMGDVEVGDVITYTLVVTNTATGAGAGSATNVLITDVAPTNTTLVGGSMAYVSGVTPVVASPATPDWTVLTLAPGESTEVSFQVTVDAGTPAGTVITNVATADSDETPPVDSPEVDNTVVAPILEITKSNAPMGDVEVGDVITYTLVVTNTATGAGAGSATNVLINDLAPTNTTLVGGSMAYVSGVTPVVASPATPDWTVLTLAPGESTEVSFQVTVDAGTPAGTVIPNTATTTSDELPVIPSNEVDNTVVAPILEITKSNSPMGDVEVGDVITYTLVVTNTASGAGAGDATNVLITDAAPANTTFVAGSTMHLAGIAPTTASPATPDWTVLTLAPGESTEVSFQVTVDAGTPAGTVITNVATADSDETPPVDSPEVDNTVVAPILEITKSNAPMGDVEVGDVITYTLVVTNTATGAGAGSATNVLINDLAPANTTLVGGSMAYVSGVTPVVASPATPDWTVLTLAPGESTEVSFQVTVDAGTPAGTVITNVATADSDETPPVDSPEVDNTVVAPILEITKSNNPMGDVEVGDVITYTLVVTNTATGAGAGSATNVLINDLAPTNTTLVGGSMAYVSGVTPVVASPATPDWTVLTLAPGESTEVSFQVTVDAGTPAGTVIPNTATTTSDELPVIPSNEVDNTVVAPILEITKSNSPMGDVEVGDVITYTLVVTNTATGAGAGSATNVLINDLAPTNTTLVGGSMAYVSGVTPVVASPATPDWTVLTLAPGESTEVSFQVTVDAGTPAGTVIPNTATTTSDELPVIPSNEVDNTVVAPILEITKSNNPMGDVEVGDVITYTLVVTNTATGAGAGSATNVLINDLAPANTTLVGGSMAYVSGITPVVASPATPDWTVATLAPGESTEVSFQVTVDAGTPAGTVIPNTATTTSDELPVIPSNEVDNTVVAPILEITKSNNPMGDVEVGDVITYTLVVTNTATGAGAGSASNVLITDVAPTNTTLVGGSMAYVSGITPVVASPATPDWTVATLAPGESTEVSFQVTVDAGTPAGTVIPNTATTTSDELPVIPSNEVDNTVVAPILELVKANNEGTVCIGDVIVYTLTATNIANGAGAGTASNVSIMDAAPANTTLVAGSPMYVSGVMPVAGSPATPNWMILALAPGESTTVSFEVTVNEVVNGTIIPNTGFVSSDEVIIPEPSNEVINEVEVPTIICPNDINTTTDEGLCSADVILTPPFVMTSNCELVSLSPSETGPFDSGSTIVTWTATYASGYTQTCEQEVIIYDYEAPGIPSCSSAYGWIGTNCLAEVYVTYEAEDNCGIASVQGVGLFELPLGVHDHVITITDVNGNVTEHELTIFIHDDVSPSVTSCPANIELTQAELANFSLPVPGFTDNCGVENVTNDAPNEFALGTTTVTWTAIDNYGHIATCSYDVTLTPTINIGNLEYLEASVESADNRATVSWNTPIVSTFCEACPTTDYTDFEHIGDYYGHQYFIYTGEPVNWAAANALAETTIGGHLASINSFAENNFLKHQLPQGVENAWLGLQIVQDETGIYGFDWSNEATLDYQNFNDVFSVTETQNVVTLQPDGDWEFTENTEEHTFIVERPCLELQQTGPYMEVQNEAGDIQLVLLESGDEWPVGEHQVVYQAADRCDNTYVTSFPVFVQEPIAEICPISGADQTLWIDHVIIDDARYNAPQEAGYQDNADLPLEIIAEQNQETAYVQLIASGNEMQQELYWNIWLDINNDGDFFDTGELIYQAVTHNDTLETNVPLALFNIDEKRLRTAVARYDYPEVCADFFSGEAEDFLVSYIDTNDGLGGINIETFGNTNGAGNDEFDNSNVFVQPNPASEFVEIITPVISTDAQLEIYNAAGQKVYTQTLSAGQSKHGINTKVLADGLYILDIRTANAQVQQKLVVKK